MKYLLLGCAALALTACSDNDNSTTLVPTPASYSITLTNLTAGQPFSPPVALLTSGDFSAWSVGTAATTALEHLAEGGSTSELIALVPDAANHASSAPIGPGASETFTIEANDIDQLNLTLATMLVNTNDAFTGVTHYSLANLATGESKSFMSHAYDAGTENNTEASGTMPGPADGGEGFNAARDDVTSTVTHHGGVVSQADGYADSVLDESHRFDNPVIKIDIERL